MKVLLRVSDVKFLVDLDYFKHIFSTNFELRYRLKVKTGDLKF